MKFAEKLKKLFVDFKISIPDIPENKYHLYADYVELIVLFANSEVTQSDILDKLYDEDIIRFESEDIENNYDLFSKKPKRDDENENWVNEIFQLINYRSFLFSSDYPFELDDDVLTLKDENKLSDKNKIYLSLLIASSLNYFKLLQPELTSEFETISYHSLINFMPKHAIVKPLGNNSFYSGNAKQKIKELSKDMNIDLNDKEILNISDRNNQERGLDLISWIPFQDKIPNFITILAQCACGKEWYKKQNETDRYENYFVFYKQKPIHALYIPYSLSKNDDDDSFTFFQSDDISKDRTIMFDRKRILEFLPTTDFFNSLQSKHIVNECINYEEDIV